MVMLVTAVEVRLVLGQSDVEAVEGQRMASVQRRVSDVEESTRAQRPGEGAIACSSVVAWRLGRWHPWARRRERHG